MGLQKNVASQKWVVFAFNRTTNVPVTGDAANITATINKDFAGANATNDTNPTELADGFYAFDLTQAESNANTLHLNPESGTADVQVIGVPGVIHTAPANFQALGIESDGMAHADVKEWKGTVPADYSTTRGTAGTALPNAAADAAGGLPISDAGGLDLDAQLGKLVGTLGAGTHTAQTGDSYARIGAPAGASVSADIAAVQSAVDAVDAFIDTEVAAIIAAIGTPSDLGSGATLASNLVDIESQTDDIGAAGAGLSAIPWNASWDAEVQSEVTDALTTALTEGYRSHGATGSAAQLLYEILAAVTNFSISSTTKTAKKLDGSTAAKTYTLDSSSAPTSVIHAS